MATKTVDPDDVRAAAAAMGRKGGPARARALTKKRRSEIARKGAEARWEKERAKEARDES